MNGGSGNLPIIPPMNRNTRRSYNLLMKRVIWVLPLVCLAGDQWPQLRGPNGAGIAEGSAPVEFGLKHELIWSATLAAGHSSPSMWDDHIFLTAFEAKEKRLIVLDVDRETGKIRWQRTVE